MRARYAGTAYVVVGGAGNVRGWPSVDFRSWGSWRAEVIASSVPLVSAARAAQGVVAVDFETGDLSQWHGGISISSRWSVLESDSQFADSVRPLKGRYFARLTLPAGGTQAAEAGTRGAPAPDNQWSSDRWPYRAGQKDYFSFGWYFPKNWQGATTYKSNSAIAQLGFNGFATPRWRFAPSDTAFSSRCSPVRSRFRGKARSRTSARRPSLPGHRLRAQQLIRPGSYFTTIVRSDSRRLSASGSSCRAVISSSCSTGCVTCGTAQWLDRGWT